MLSHLVLSTDALIYGDTPIYVISSFSNGSNSIQSTNPSTTIVNSLFLISISLSSKISLSYSTVTIISSPFDKLLS